MDVRCRVGLTIRKYREARGLSQEAFALECEIHRTYVSGVDRSIRNPTVVVLEKIASARPSVLSRATFLSRAFHRRSSTQSWKAAGVVRPGLAAIRS